VNKRREIKRLAEKAVGDIIEMLYKHTTPIGSICIQVATNELPPDDIPILHLANAEVTVDKSIVLSPVRYVLAPEYFGERIRDKMKLAARKEELRAKSIEDAAQYFVDKLKTEGIDKSIIYLEETGFNDYGIRQVFSSVLDRIQQKNPPRPEPVNIDLEEIEPMPPPSPPPEPIAEPLSTREELILRDQIRRRPTRTIVEDLDSIINTELRDSHTGDTLNIPPIYADDEQVRACRVIRSYFDDITDTNFIGFEDKIEITTRARGQNISVDVIRSMIAMFNNIRQIGQRHTRLNTNHRAQAQALVHYLFGNDTVISLRNGGRLTLCGQLLGVYEPYVIEEVAKHNTKANRILNATDAVNSVREVDTVDEEDLQAAADVYDRVVEDARGDLPIPTASQLDEARIVDNEMEWREHTEFRLGQIDPNRNYVQVIEEYYTDFIHNIGWISDPDRSYLTLELCRQSGPTRTSRTPAIMHEVINILNSREHLPVTPSNDLSDIDNEDLRVSIDQFNDLNRQLNHLDPSGGCRVAIQDYFNTFLYSIGWISSEDRSQLIDPICEERDINPDLMNHIVTFLNSRENLPVGRSVPTRGIFNRPSEEVPTPARVVSDEEDDEEELPEGFTPEELIIDIDDIPPSNERHVAHRLIIDYLRGENIDVDYIDNAHRGELLELATFEEIEHNVMTQAINQFNGDEEDRRRLFDEMETRRESAEEPTITITSETVLDGTMQRINVDVAALQLFARITGTTRDDVDSIGRRVSDELTTELFARADENNIPRDSMSWAIRTYNSIHGNEPMSTYNDEHSRQSVILINSNYESNYIISDDDRLDMIHKAELFGIDSHIFISRLDIHNRAAHILNEASEEASEPETIPRHERI